MKIFGTSFARTGVITACVALIFASGVLAGPKLEFKPEAIDLGRLPVGETVRRTIELRNAGDAELVISQVRPSCTECIVEKFEEIRLKPGETRSFSVTYAAATAPGKRPAHLTFHSNDPENPLKRFGLEVEVISKGAARVSAEPTRVAAGIIRVGEATRFQVTLENTGTATLKIAAATPGPGVIAPEHVEPVEPNGKRVVSCVVTPTKPGIFRSYVIFSTNAEENPSASVQIEGYAATEEEIARLLAGGILIRKREGDGILSVANGLGAPVHLEGAKEPIVIAPGKESDVPLPEDKTELFWIRLGIPGQTPGDFAPERKDQ